MSGEAPKRNGGRRRRRPPLSLGPLVWPVKARPPFPGRFRPRPCGPGRSLRFPSRNIAIPGRSPAGPAPCLAAGHGSLAGSEFSALRLRNSVPYRSPRKRSFFGVLSRNLPPGGFRFRRTLEGKWVRLWLAPPPRASSFRLPGTLLRSASVRRRPPLSAGPRLGASSVSGRARPATGRTLAPESDSHQALFWESGLWITGITGITQVKPATGPPPCGRSSARRRSAR